MPSRRGKPTRYPGVYRLGPGKYLLRAKPIDPKTRRTRDLEWVVEASGGKEAAEERTRRISEIERDARKDMPRLQTYALSWLNGKLPTVRASTRRHYADVLQLHINPVFGDWFIDTITHEDVVAWRDSMEGAPVTINGRLRVLKTMMADATQELPLQRDPTVRVQAVRKRHVEEEEASKCLTVDELRRLLEAVNVVAPQWHALTLTLALTGARWGAVTALRWDDIDFEAGVIRFRRAQWRQHIDATKTSVLRSVPLPAELAEALREKRRQMVADQVPGLDAGWVFPSSVGTLPYQSVMRKPLDRAIAHAKLEKRPGVHWFRHTLNNLIRQVSTRDVQKSITGHLTDGMAEHYSHVAMTEKRAAIGQVVALLGAGGGGFGGGSPNPVDAPEDKG